MYFIRVSWKCIANVEMEAEGGGGREAGEGGAELAGPQWTGPTCLAPSHTSGLTSSWDNSRVGKLRGLCLTREPLWSQVSRSVTLGSPMAQKAWGGELGWSAGLSLSLQGK